MKLRRNFPYLAVVTFFTLLAVAPLVFTFFSSFFNDNGGFTLANYEGVFNKEKLKLLFDSCLTGAVAAALSTAAGAIIAWILSKTNVPVPGFLKLLFLIPLFVSPYYFAVAWRDVFTVAGVHSVEETNWIVTIPWINTQVSGLLIFIHVFCFFPLPMLIISGALANINRNIIEAGQLTASRLRVLFTLELPLIKHAFFSSFILVFILSISEVAVATYFLVPSFSSNIFVQFSAFYNHGGAIASSTLLILVCVGLLAFEYSYFMSNPFLSIGTKGNPTKKIQLKIFRFPVLIALLGLWALVILVPVAGLSRQAFKAPPEFSQVRQNIVPTEGGGETGYYVKQAYGLLSQPMQESLLLAAIGAVVICGLAFVFAYFAQRKGYKLIDAVSLIVFAVPATVFGIALIKFYNRPVSIVNCFNYRFRLDDIYSSFLIILIAYIGRFVFIASKVMSHAIGKVPFSLEQSAMIAGASRLRRIVLIVLPLIAEGFFATFIITFVFCLGELGTTIVVYPPGSSLLPIKIATAMHSTPEGLMSAMVFIALAVTFGALALLFAGYSLITRNRAWKEA